MTYAEAIAAGYKDGYTRYQRGYVSRKIKCYDNLPVHRTRDGRLYILIPCYTSTNYCYRLYLIK